MNVVTGSDIRRPRILDALTKALVLLHIRLEARGELLPTTTEITFEVETTSDETKPVVKYYVVDHARMTEFWFKENGSAIPFGSSKSVDIPVNALGQLSE